VLALVTGASSGIGQATSRVLAEKGYDLILLARRMDRLESLKKEIQAAHPERRIQSYSVDISNSADVEAFFKNQSQELKDITVLINSAGLALGLDKFQDSNLKDWDTMLKTNVIGLLQVTHSVIPYFIKNNQGHIVNLGSVAGTWTYPGGAVYCATKSALKSVTEGLRLDLMGTLIRVTNIQPGMVETEFSEVRFGDSKKAKAVYQNMTPLKATDIANTILWCLSQPPHVNIQDVVIFPTDQAGVGYVHRKTPHL
jgi:NADP-dependent 3-hydroxy acid dehydrogenase YdfG